jgi:HK97 family phage major capsid protein
MSRNTFENWIPEEFDSAVIQKVNQTSAVEQFAQAIPMATQTRSTPRSGGMGVALVAKGAAYSEDTSTNDQVILNVQKFGSAVRIAEEDINDSLADIVNAKMVDWATSYAKAFDVACLGVTAAKGTSGCAFDSLYYQLTQTGTGYTANANLIQTAGAVTYADLSDIVGKVEEGDFFDEAATVVIAHPSFKGVLRELVDSQGRPIFNESTNGTAGGGQGGPRFSLFGYDLQFSLGARTSTTVTSAPTGNPLLVVANRNLLLKGVRSGPESVFIDGRNGLAALTDESILKMRARRAFNVGHLTGTAVLEVTAGS